MKTGGSKNKGSEFERLVGKKISLWLSQGQRKDLICRTVLSGGQFTVSGLGNPGDLMAQHPLAFKFFEKFVLECKHWKNVEMIRFLAADDCGLYKALKKVQREADKHQKFYMLIVRQNHQKIMLFMPTQAVGLFTNGLASRYHVLFSGNVYMYYFDEFLGVVTLTNHELIEEAPKPN